MLFFWGLVDCFSVAWLAVRDLLIKLFHLGLFIVVVCFMYVLLC